MSNSGNLIQLHHHDNLDLLKYFIEKDGLLYYKNISISPSVSKKANNALILEQDGFYINNTTFLNNDQYNIISRFSYNNGNLLFDNMIVSQEYTELQIRVMLDTLWDDIEKELGGDTSDITES